LSRRRACGRGPAEQPLPDGSRHVVFQLRASRVQHPAPSIEGEAAGVQVSGKTLSFRHSGLARLVFRPAVKRGMPEDLWGTLLLAGDRVTGVAPGIVAVDRRAEMGVVLVVAVYCVVDRQARAEIPRGIRKATTPRP